MENKLALILWLAIFYGLSDGASLVKRSNLGIEMEYTDDGAEFTWDRHSAFVNFFLEFHKAGQMWPKIDETNGIKLVLSYEYFNEKLAGIDDLKVRIRSVTADDTEFITNVPVTKANMQKAEANRMDLTIVPTFVSDGIKVSWDQSADWHTYTLEYQNGADSENPWIVIGQTRGTELKLTYDYYKQNMEDIEDPKLRVRVNTTATGVDREVNITIVKSQIDQGAAQYFWNVDASYDSRGVNFVWNRNDDYEKYSLEYKSGDSWQIIEETVGTRLRLSYDYYQQNLKDIDDLKLRVRATTAEGHSSKSNFDITKSEIEAAASQYRTEDVNAVNIGGQGQSSVIDQSQQSSVIGKLSGMTMFMVDPASNIASLNLNYNPTTEAHKPVSYTLEKFVGNKWQSVKSVAPGGDVVLSQADMVKLTDAQKLRIRVDETSGKSWYSPEFDVPSEGESEQGTQTLNIQTASDNSMTFTYDTAQFQSSEGHKLEKFENGQWTTVKDVQEAGRVVIDQSELPLIRNAEKLRIRSQEETSPEQSIGQYNVPLLVRPESSSPASGLRIEDKDDGISVSFAPSTYEDDSGNAVTPDQYLEGLKDGKWVQLKKTEEDSVTVPKAQLDDVDAIRIRSDGPDGKEQFSNEIPTNQRTIDVQMMQPEDSPVDMVSLGVTHTQPKEETDGQTISYAIETFDNGRWTKVKDISPVRNVVLSPEEINELNNAEKVRIAGRTESGDLVFERPIDLQTVNSAVTEQIERSTPTLTAPGPISVSQKDNGDITLSSTPAEVPGEGEQPSQVLEVKADGGWQKVKDVTGDSVTTTVDELGDNEKPVVRIHAKGPNGEDSYSPEIILDATDDDNVQPMDFKPTGKPTGDVQDGSLALSYDPAELNGNPNDETLKQTLEKLEKGRWTRVKEAGPDKVTLTPQELSDISNAEKLRIATEEPTSGSTQYSQAFEIAPLSLSEISAPEKVDNQPAGEITIQDNDDDDDISVSFTPATVKDDSGNTVTPDQYLEGLKNGNWIPLKQTEEDSVTLPKSELTGVDAVRIRSGGPDGTIQYSQEVPTDQRRIDVMMPQPEDSPVDLVSLGVTYAQPKEEINGETISYAIEKFDNGKWTKVKDISPVRKVMLSPEEINELNKAEKVRIAGRTESDDLVFERLIDMAKLNDAVADKIENSTPTITAPGPVSVTQGEDGDLSLSFTPAEVPGQDEQPSQVLEVKTDDGWKKVKDVTGGTVTTTVDELGDIEKPVVRIHATGPNGENSYSPEIVLDASDDDNVKPVDFKPTGKITGIVEDDSLKLNYPKAVFNGNDNDQTLMNTLEKFENGRWTPVKEAGPSDVTLAPSDLRNLNKPTKLRIATEEPTTGSVQYSPAFEITQIPVTEMSAPKVTKVEERVEDIKVSFEPAKTLDDKQKPEQFLEVKRNGKWEEVKKTGNNNVKVPYHELGDDVEAVRIRSDGPNGQVQYSNEYPVDFKPRNEITMDFMRPDEGISSVELSYPSERVSFPSPFRWESYGSLETDDEPISFSIDKLKDDGKWEKVKDVPADGKVEFTTEEYEALDGSKLRIKEKQGRNEYYSPSFTVPEINSKVEEQIKQDEPGKGPEDITVAQDGDQLTVSFTPAEDGNESVESSEEGGKQKGIGNGKNKDSSSNEEGNKGKRNKGKGPKHYLEEKIDGEWITVKEVDNKGSVTVSLDELGDGPRHTLSIRSELPNGKSKRSPEMVIDVSENNEIQEVSFTPPGPLSGDIENGQIKLSYGPAVFDGDVNTPLKYTLEKYENGEWKYVKDAGPDSVTLETSELGPDAEGLRIVATEETTGSSASSPEMGITRTGLSLAPKPKPMSMSFIPAEQTVPETDMVSMYLDWFKEKTGSKPVSMALEKKKDGKWVPVAEVDAEENIALSPNDLAAGDKLRLKVKDNFDDTWISPEFDIPSAVASASEQGKYFKGPGKISSNRDGDKVSLSFPPALCKASDDNCVTHPKQFLEVQGENGWVELKPTDLNSVDVSVDELKSVDDGDLFNMRIRSDGPDGQVEYSPAHTVDLRPEGSFDNAGPISGTIDDGKLNLLYDPAGAGGDNAPSLSNILEMSKKGQWTKVKDAGPTAVPVGKDELDSMNMADVDSFRIGTEDEAGNMMGFSGDFDNLPVDLGNILTPETWTRMSPAGPVTMEPEGDNQALKFRPASYEDGDGCIQHPPQYVEVLKDGKWEEVKEADMGNVVMTPEDLEGAEAVRIRSDEPDGQASYSPVLSLEEDKSGNPTPGEISAQETDDGLSMNFRPAAYVDDDNCIQHPKQYLEVLKDGEWVELKETDVGNVEMTPEQLEGAEAVRIRADNPDGQISYSPVYPLDKDKGKVTNPKITSAENTDDGVSINFKPASYLDDENCIVHPPQFLEVQKNGKWEDLKETGLNDVSASNAELEDADAVRIRAEGPDDQVEYSEALSLPIQPASYVPAHPPEGQSEEEQEGNNEPAVSYGPTPNPMASGAGGPSTQGFADMDSNFPAVDDESEDNEPTPPTFTELDANQDEAPTQSDESEDHEPNPTFKGDANQVETDTQSGTGDVDYKPHHSSNHKGTGIKVATPHHSSSHVGEGIKVASPHHSSSHTGKGIKMASPHHSSSHQGRHEEADPDD